MAPYCLPLRLCLTSFPQPFRLTSPQSSHNHDRAPTGLPCLPPSCLHLAGLPALDALSSFLPIYSSSLSFRSLFPSHLLQEALGSAACTEPPLSLNLGLDVPQFTSYHLICTQPCHSHIASCLTPYPLVRLRGFSIFKCTII